MQIAIVHPSLSVKGGAENVVVWLASGLVNYGHQVRVITSTADRKLFTAVPWNFETVELGGDGYRFDWSEMRKMARRLRPHLDGADLVNPHNFPANYWTYWALPHGSARVAWYCQEPLRWLYTPPLDAHVQRLRAIRGEVAPRSVRRLGYYLTKAHEMGYLRALREFDTRRRVKAIDHQVANWYPLVMTNSVFVASQIRLLFGIDANVCRLGIPVGPAPEEKRPGTDSRIELLMVTRLVVAKNVDTALRAMRALPEPVRSAVRLTVIGIGPDLPQLLRLRSALGLEREVVFRGMVSDDELDRAYRTADALIYLTLDETFGLAYAEAAARAIPCIGPDHGGPVEFIDDGRTGLTVDALDPNAVAGAIVRLASHPELRREMGRAARQKVEADYTVDAMVRRYLRLVESGLRKAA